MKIIEDDGYDFKDLNGKGKLDPYEDWHLDYEIRIKDLVSRMHLEQIAGLMLYSGQQSGSFKDDVFSKFFQVTYDALT